MFVKVKLGLGETSNSNAVVKGNYWVGKMTGNALFLAALIVAQIIKVKNATIALVNALSAPKSETKTNDIEKAREIWDSEVKILAGMVEGVANDTSVADADRIGIVLSAGMQVMEFAGRQDQYFHAVAGPLSGTATVYAKGGAPANMWTYTYDVENFTNRVEIQGSTAAHYLFTGLMVDKKCAFFHKDITPDGLSNWEGPDIITIL